MTPCGQHPLIDISHLRHPDPTSPHRLHAISSIRTALLDYGYFYASAVSEFAPTYLEEMYDYARRCHALPAEVKRKYGQRDGGTGSYSGPDVGLEELRYEGKGGAMATVSGWDYSRVGFSLGSSSDGTDADAADSIIMDQRPALPVPPAEDGRYPSTQDGIDPPFAVAMDELYGRQDVLGRVLLEGFEDALGVPRRTFLDMFEGGDGGPDFGTIRLLSYPGRPVEGDVQREGNGDGENKDDDDDSDTERTGIGAHTDFECFTLMHQNAPGLQLMPRCRDALGHGHGHGHGNNEFGKWIDAPVRPGDFLVIIGDMFERLTNGMLRATPHRVCLTDHPRESIIRFNAFAPDTIVRPLDVFVNTTADGMPRPLYTPVKMRMHMETTMRNLEKGIASWDAEEGRSRSATYEYNDE